MSSDEENDPPQLSAETYAALQQFYAEEKQREELLLSLGKGNTDSENIVIDENWQLSQFWYDDTTITNFVKIVTKIMPPNGRIALISCPTLYSPVRRNLDDTKSVKLFEYDRRFEVHSPNFIFYDYNYPEKFPQELVKSFDLVIADPPFLAEECLEKTCRTIKLLAKDKIVICTGAVMKENVEKLLGLNVCNFKPQHQNNLANEFSCYANFNLDSLIF